MPAYPTIDYLPDMTPSEMSSAARLTLSPYTPIYSGIGWDNSAFYSTTRDYAILYDDFFFTGKAGATYDVYSSSYFDPYILRVFDAQGNVIAVDDDSGGYGTDHAEFVAPYSGTYYVTASWNQGSYYKYSSISIYEDVDTIKPSVFTGTSGSDVLTGTSDKDTLSGLGGNDVINGAGGNDVLEGGSGDDDLTPGSGDDYVNGGSGTDTIHFSGKRGNYTITKTSTGLTVKDFVGTEGNDSVSDSEKLVFSDFTVNLKAGDNSKLIPTSEVSELVELYIAFFNRIPDSDGLSYWIGQRKNGLSIDSIADSFYSAATQFTQLSDYTPTMSDSDFVKVVYKNVLGRSGLTAPSDGDVAYWAGKLSSGESTKGSLVQTMLNSAHSFDNHPTWGWVADLLERKVAVGRYFALEQGLNYTSSNDAITKGMAIAQAVTATDSSVAIGLIGVSDTTFSLSS